MKSVTLSGRKRTKDLSQDSNPEINILTDPSISKKYQLNKLKEEVESNNTDKEAARSINSNIGLGPESVSAKSPNLKIRIASIVRYYKSNAQAGTRSALKYTIDQQRYLLLDKIQSYIDEYSSYGKEYG